MAIEQDQIISIRNLSKSFDNIKAVNDLTLTVHYGDVYGFLGPNGSGKSTTIRLLLSLIRSDAGEIKIFNKDIGRNRKDILSRIGALIEKPDFYDYLSAFRNLQLMVDYGGYDVEKTRIMEVLEMVGLKDRAHSRVKTFSKGMKQRLGIAQAIVHDPDLVILDEPGNGLDPQGIKDIRELILHLNKDHKKTVFLSSHLLYEVELIANRMIIIDSGKAVVEGEVQKLLDNFDVKTYFSVSNLEAALNVLKESDLMMDHISIENNRFYIRGKRDLIPRINRLLIDKGIEVYSINQIQTLEDYFMNLT